jgi:hypothetical protein
MAALTAGLIGLSLLKTGLDYYGQRKAADASEAQGNFEGEQLDQQAADTITQGQAAESRYRTDVKGTIGAQRAGYGGQGVDVASGTAKDLQTETQQIGDFDARTIRNNALRQAHGLNMQADFARQGGKNLAAAQRTQSWGTLLTGGAQAVGMAQDAGWFNRSAGGGVQIPKGIRAPSTIGRAV